jgi:hypothetical protein
MLIDNLTDQIALAASPVELDEAVKAMWGHHFAGDITETEVEVLDEAARARRDVLQPPRAETRPKLRPAPSSPSQRPVRPRRAIPRSPDRVASRQRRRDVGQERWLPPNIASQLTQGEISVLSVMVREIVNHGVCDLPNDKIAGLAGVCPTLVKNTRRRAENEEWIKVIHRPVRGQKSLTNLICALSPELRTWIATRRKMIGGKFVPPTKTGNSTTSSQRSGMVPGYRSKGLSEGRFGPKTAPDRGSG